MDTKRELIRAASYSQANLEAFQDSEKKPKALAATRARRVVEIPLQCYLRLPAI